MIWYDMIWYDMIWYDMIWYDMIWYEIIYHIISYHIISYHIISYHIISYHIISYIIISITMSTDNNVYSYVSAVFAERDVKKAAEPGVLRLYIKRSTFFLSAVYLWISQRTSAPNREVVALHYYYWNKDYLSAWGTRLDCAENVSRIFLQPANTAQLNIN